MKEGVDPVEVDEGEGRPCVDEEANRSKCHLSCMYLKPWWYKKYLRVRKLTPIRHLMFINKIIVFVLTEP